MRTWRELPQHLLVAAAIIFAYGTVGLAVIVWGAATTGDLDGVLRPGLNSVSMLCIAWGLLTRQHWGWWLGVLVVGFRATMAVVALGAFGYFSLTEPDALGDVLLRIEAISGQSFVWAMGWGVLLVAAFVLLLSPRTRDVFREARARRKE